MSIIVARSKYYGPDETCTLTTCPVKHSIFQYQPSLAANSVFIGLFGLVLLVQTAQGFKWRVLSFTIAMVLGCITEIIGYIGRIMMYHNPFSFNGFLIEIICITIAPAFYSAAIYFTLSKIVIFLGAKHSRFSPNLYYWIFIPCDIISLTLQATGGALSSTSQGVDQSGVDISLAGLSFQVFSLVVFIVLAVDFAIRYLRSKDAKSDSLPTSFKTFIALLSLATLFILIRCTYRIDELSDGYSGSLIHDQGLFIALEGVMVVLATFCLTIGHPGWALQRASRSEGMA